MNLKEIERVVGSIRSHLFRNSNSFSIGMLRSHFKGSGLQFKEHQVYNPGDDVRFIDWNLSAKSDNTYIKTFEEERNVEIIVVLDITETMMIGYKNISKLQAAIEVACLLYLLAEQTKDKVKLVLINEEVTILPSNSGQKGIILLVSFLEKMNIMLSDGSVNLKFRCDKLVSEKKRLALLKSFIARRKEVVYLSDFSAIENMEELNKLIYRRNMHCFKVTSPVDEAADKPYSILTSILGKTNLLQAKIKNQRELHGKWKKINVADRYLEQFIKEML